MSQHRAEAVVWKYGIRSLWIGCLYLGVPNLGVQCCMVQPRIVELEAPSALFETPACLRARTTNNNAGFHRKVVIAMVCQRCRPVVLVVDCSVGGMGQVSGRMPLVIRIRGSSLRECWVGCIEAWSQHISERDYINSTTYILASIFFASKLAQPAMPDLLHTPAPLCACSAYTPAGSRFGKFAAPRCLQPSSDGLQPESDRLQPFF